MNTELIHQTINGRDYGIIAAEKSIRVLTLAHELEKAAVVSIYKNVQIILGMPIELLQHCIQNTKLKIALMKPMQSPSNSNVLFMDMCIMPTKEYTEMTCICKLIINYGIIQCIQFDQSALYSERYKVDKRNLSILHRLTLGNDESQWVSNKAITSVCTATNQKQSRFISSIHSNRIDVYNEQEGIIYTFFKDKKGYMNLLSVKLHTN